MTPSGSTSDSAPPEAEHAPMAPTDKILRDSVPYVAPRITAATAVQNADFHTRLAAATPENPANGADIVAQQRLGESLNVAAWVSWGTVGVAAVVTGVLALFTNWSGEELDEPPGPGASTEGPADAAR
jgi:hypothetical protein